MNSLFTYAWVVRVWQLTNVCLYAQTQVQLLTDYQFLSCILSWSLVLFLARVWQGCSAYYLISIIIAITAWILGSQVCGTWPEHFVVICYLENCSRATCVLFALFRVTFFFCLKNLSSCHDCAAQITIRQSHN